MTSLQYYLRSGLAAFVLFCWLVINSGCVKDHSLTAPPLTGSDTTSHVFQWSKDTVGNSQSFLSGVWGTGGTNVYACGLIYLPNRLLPVDIIKWDGERWSPIDHLEGILNGVFGFGASDVWFVGAWLVDTNSYALIVHWNGVSWTTWKLPQYNQLFSVWGTSSSNLYAVGWAGVILHYDGVNWTKQNSGTTLNLRSIWGSDGAHIFVAGNRTDGAEGILLQSDLPNWKAITKGGTNLDSSTLYGEFESVWCTREDALFLVGSLCYEGGPANWKLSAIPFNSPGANLTGLAGMNAIRGNSPNNIFVSGFYDLIIHWNGRSWHTYSQFFDKSSPSSLNSVWVEDRVVFIAGYESSDNRAIIYRGTQ